MISKQIIKTNQNKKNSYCQKNKRNQLKVSTIIKNEITI